MKWAILIAASVSALSISPAGARAERPLECSAGVSAAWRALTGKNPPFEHCCVRHDLDYRRGGTSDDRWRADDRLKACVIATGRVGWAMIMFGAVRISGQVAYPFDWAGGLEKDPSAAWYHRRDEHVP